LILKAKDAQRAKKKDKPGAIKRIGKRGKILFP